jgi:hypothetical protein
MGQVMGVDFQVVDVSSWQVYSQEPAGRHANSWLVSPQGERWLFKPVVIHGERRQGEDWAEKTTAELARLLTVPAAEVELAIRGPVEGCISRNLKPAGWEMQTGAVLLQEFDPRLEPRSRSRTGHTLENIQGVLSDCKAPPGFTGPDTFDAFDVFCGYLAFDAVVANRDRHEENWSVLRDAVGQISLAGSYDHASSLGFGETEHRRRAVLAGSQDLEHWARRGTAVRFEGGAKITLVDFAAASLRRVRAEVREYWLDRLQALSWDSWVEILESTQVMSEVARRFCARLVEINRRRMLNAG